MGGTAVKGQSLATPKKDTIRIWQRPYRYALALVILGALVIGYIPLAVDSSVSLIDKFSQVGAGLAASAIFAAIYTVFANKEYARMVKAEIAESLTDHRAEVSREIHQFRVDTTATLTGHCESEARQIREFTAQTSQSLSEHREVTLHQIRQLDEIFLPTAQYPASGKFDLRFNKDLTRDLCDSDFYFFRGTSAKYVPARLRKFNHRLNETQIILLDPRERSAIEARVADRRRKPGASTKSHEELVAEVEDEIFYALVALFDCREHCEIEIGFSGVTSPVRVELFQKAIYTSLYRTPESQRNEHPETVRFGPSSQMYQIFRDESRRQLHLTPNRWRFEAHHKDPYLCDLISTLGINGVRESDLQRWRQAYRDFIRPFDESLDEIGYEQ